MPDNTIDDHLGPVAYLAIEFPAGNVTAGGFIALAAQVEAGTIVVLDPEFAEHRDGSWRKIRSGSLDVPGAALGEFEGADSSLLDDSDRNLLSEGVAEDSILAVLVCENLVLNAALSAWGTHGATLVAEGPVSLEDLDAALDESDHDQSSA